MKNIVVILVGLVVLAGSSFALPNAAKVESKAVAGSPGVTQVSLPSLANVQLYLSYSTLNITEAVGNTKVNLQYTPTVGCGIEYNNRLAKTYLGYNVGFYYTPQSGLNSSYSTGSVGISSLYANLFLSPLKIKANPLNVGLGLNFPFWSAAGTNINGNIGFQAYLEYLISFWGIKLGYQNLSGNFSSAFGASQLAAGGFFARVAFVRAL